MLFWRKPALAPTKNYENKTVCVFFQGAFDGNAPGRRNISQKSKNNEKLNFQKVDFLKIVFFIRIDAPMYFLHVSDPGTPQKPDFFTYRFFENSNFHQDRCPDVFFGGFHPGNTPKIPQKMIYIPF